MPLNTEDAVFRLNPLLRDLSLRYPLNLREISIRVAISFDTESPANQLI